MRNAIFLRSGMRAVFVLALIAIGVTGTAHALPPVAAQSPAFETITNNTFALTSDTATSGLLLNDQQSLQLDPATALPAPTAVGFQQYAFYESPTYTLPHPTNTLTVDYTAGSDTHSVVLLDVRGTPDGDRWTPWSTDLLPGATATLPETVRAVQYRVRMFASNGATPTLQAVQVQPQAAPLSAADTPPYGREAPTYKLWASREGLVGYTTANGHVIRPQDIFVALPSWKVLSSRGGNDYEVRLSYEGRSIVAPTWDVGPWNTRDNYWDESRDIFPDLPLGRPQSTAAHFDRHNGGFSGIGLRVTNPAAIDLSDRIWWEILQLPDRPTEIEVTFLWQGRDPLGPQPPSLDPNADSYEVNELGPAFIRNLDEGEWNNGPVGCGELAHSYWTTSTTDEASVDTRAFWQPFVPREGLYDVYVHVPDCPSDVAATEQARYLVQYAGGAEEVVIDQQTQKGWVLLGRYPFAEGSSGFVHLTDLAGDADRAVWFDNARWAPVRDAE